MNQHEFVAAAYQLVLMTGDLGGKVMGMDEAPSDKISKYSWFMMASRETGGQAKVVRNAVVGWGAEQKASLVAAVQDWAASKNALSAYVASYGTPSSPAVRVEAFFKKSKFAIEFPYVVTDNGIDFSPPLDSTKEDVGSAVTQWAGQAVRKKFLGLF
jgi:hypothetical protein